MDSVSSIQRVPASAGELAFEENPEVGGGGLEIDFRVLWLIFKRNIWIIGGIVLAATLALNLIFA